MGAMGQMGGVQGNGMMTAMAAMMAQQQGMGAQRDDLKRKVDEINRERKAEQLGAGERLHGLDQKWKTLVFGNRQVEEACLAMEADIKRLKGGKE